MLHPLTNMFTNLKLVTFNLKVKCTKENEILKIKII